MYVHSTKTNTYSPLQDIITGPLYFSLKSGGREKRERSERRRNECRRPTDEELFYDPHMDEEDEKWVQRQRMAYHNGQSATVLFSLHACMNID